VSHLDEDGNWMISLLLGLLNNTLSTALVTWSLLTHDMIEVVKDSFKILPNGLKKTMINHSQHIHDMHGQEEDSFESIINEMVNK
jgi:hypothetical protein